MDIYSDATMEEHVNEHSRVEVPERFPAALAGVEAAKKAGVPVQHRPCRPAPIEVLARVHDDAYLDGFKRLSANGGGYLDPDTALGPGSWEVAWLAAGAAVGAVESALSGTPAFAVVRPPGHHATRTRAMGFCLLNSAAVAAGHARSMGVRRIAILDWDVHHGNGTQDIFYESAEVLYLSAHRSPFYPGTGAAREIGEGPGRGFTINVPLPCSSGEEVYAATFVGVFVPVLREFRPELIIVSAGYDAHADDPLGGMRLKAATFGRFAAELACLACEIGAAPLALALEGGYDLKALTASIAATIEGAETEKTPGWKSSGGVREVDASRRTLAPFWKSLQ